MERERGGEPRAGLDYSSSTKIYDSSYASLFRGVRRADGSPIVLKRLRSEHPSAIDLARLRHEHAILRSLALPGVVRTYGLVATESGPGLLLEDIGEQSIRTIIRSGRPSIGRFLELAIAMTRVVDSIHEHNILHKDIKPDHFFIDPATGACKMIDFGIATRLSREVQPAMRSDWIEGTFAYISPEQTGRMNRVVDQRSDLYSLGVTLYELLTGALPFSGADPLELAHSHIARTPAPPDELAPGVPPVVSAIVMKLLAKVAEDRYQSAAGLLADLERCAAQLGHTGRIDSFPLGRDDRSGILRIPQRLYGREAEVAALVASFERVRGGTAELLLVRGPSGVGKSAVVSELHKRLVLRGHFAAGKFDQLDRAVPYAPISSACRDLVRSILAKRSAELDQWAGRLRAALGPNGRVVAELVPELELVLGPQPPPTELGPTEAQHRFELVFRNFLQAFASAEHPLVLFLDDLQWADVASLRLLKGLLTGPERGHLLVLGAYRDSEVGPGHVLEHILQELAEAGARIESITLRPLGPDEVRALFADALGCDADRAAPLADLALRKTLGNPFFLTQFLTTLVDECVLVFDLVSRRWTWELDWIEELMVTANVVDLLVGRIHRLPAETQEVLQVAACIGHRVDLKTLTTAVGRPVPEVSDAVWDLLSLGLLVPLDQRYQYIRSGELAAEALADLDASYRFLHDRVQQAAYALVDPDRRAAVHLQIGRLLLARSGGSPPDKILFDLVNHMVLGSSLVTDPAERRELARLGLRAGLRARDSAAHEAALGFLTHSLDLLGDRAWTDEYEIACAAHLAATECHDGLGQFEAALAALDVLDREAHTVEHRAPGRILKASILTKLSRFDEACAAGVEAAVMLGLEIPTDTEALRSANRTAFAALQEELAGRHSALADLPVMTDPRTRALARALSALIAPGFLSNRDLYEQAIIQGVAHSLRWGNSPDVEFYSSYAIYHRMVTRDAAAAYRIGREAVRLCERPLHRSGATVAHFLFATFVSHAQAHVSEAIDHLRQAVRAGLENGDYVNLNFCVPMLPAVRFSAGDDLEEVAHEIDVSRALLKSIGDRINWVSLSRLAHIVAELRGTVGEPAGPDPDAASLVANPLSQGLFATLGLIRATLAGDPRASAAAVSEVVPFAPFIGGLVQAADLAFHGGLARAQLLGEVPAEERPALVALLDRDEADLAERAASAPANHAHQAALVAAARAAATGSTEAAMNGFDRAIALAREHRFTHHEGLASELCARFHLEAGRSKIARVYLVDAYHAYVRWGAVGVAHRLAARYPELLAEVSAPNAAAGPSTMTDHTAAVTLDVATGMRMMQAIAGELVLGRLIERLMRSLVENAGAQRGFLVVPRESRLQLSAAVSVEPDEVRLDLGQDLESSDELSVSIIHYVARSREPIVLADATEGGPFRRDPYVLRARPRSILCVPMIQQGRLSGVLYLENNVATGAFDPTRVQLLQFLAAQAAVAIENAMLYREMESRVEERTAALAAANERLQASLEELGRTQRRLIDMSRQAGMADVAISILHNVGNALASVNVSAESIRATIAESRSSGLARVVRLLAERQGDLARFLTEDPRGRQIPRYLEQLAKAMDGERRSLGEELGSLFGHLENIQVIVDRQQSHASRGGMLETVVIADLLDDAIRLHGAAAEHGDDGVVIARDYAAAPPFTTDRHKVLQIVVHLLRNARRAVREAEDRTITVRCRTADPRILISVEDRGVGISAEALEGIFHFGFTTKEGGRCFGLHASANAAAEVRGTLTAHSDGPGRGAVFLLDLPLVAPVER